MTKVPFLDLAAGYAELRDELDDAQRRVMASGRYIGGDEVEAFEREFAAFCGVRRAVGTGNGLDALTLALRALGAGRGDEVVVPAHTFIATWLAVTAVGATPVPVDVEADTGNIDPRRAEAAVSARTKAIVAVHLHGQPADVEALQRLGPPVVEDAAQAHGARWGARRAGALGTIAAFSFYPGKNLGAYGDAGAVVTDDPALADRVRLLSNYGMRMKYDHEALGVNSRLDPLQAACLRVKLRHLDTWNARRTAIAQTYLESLAAAPDLTLPTVRAQARHAWHLFAVRSPARDELAARLADHGVQTLVHYPVPPHRSGAYRATHGHHHLAVAESWARQTLSLPIGPHLSAAQVDRVLGAMRGFGRCVA
jgi:dTDP-3-amino-3,4,6-trideoxy-alpha-D-glucose transaminase